MQGGTQGGTQGGSGVGDGGGDVGFNLYTPLVQQGSPERGLRNHILHGAVHDTQGHGGVRLYVITLPVDGLFWRALGNAHDTLYSLLLSTFCDTLFQILFQFRKANNEMVKEHNYDANVGKCHEDCCVACGPHHGRYLLQAEVVIVVGGIEEERAEEKENEVEEEPAVKAIHPQGLEGLQQHLQEQQYGQEEPGHKSAHGSRGERHQYERDPSENQPEPQPESEFWFVGVPDGVVDGLILFEELDLVEQSWKHEDEGEWDDVDRQQQPSSEVKSCRHLCRFLSCSAALSRTEGC